MLITRSSRFGTDLGDVVIARPRVNGVLIEKPTTKQFVEAPPIPGALDAISRIIDLITPEQFFVISKVRQDYETLLWLNHHDFYRKTGFLRRNLRFCRQIDEKGPIADDLPGGPLTHFSDDRADVLAHMPNVRCRYLFGPQCQPQSASTVFLVPALTWGHILQDLL